MSVLMYVQALTPGPTQACPGSIAGLSLTQVMLTEEESWVLPQVAAGAVVSAPEYSSSHVCADVCAGTDACAHGSLTRQHCWPESPARNDQANRVWTLPQVVGNFGDIR